MAAAKRLICAAGDLPERGKGVRFTVDSAGGPATAFAVRYRGQVYGYVNRCAHVGVELDWQPGEFFDVSGLYLVCSTHGAAYLPDTGYCAGGPCKGQKLNKLPIVEQDGQVYLVEIEETHHG
ncbi:MAG: Rieske (2Fe-2S) protein [Betaproteobacteria bacterium]